MIFLRSTQPCLNTGSRFSVNEEKEVERMAGSHECSAYGEFEFESHNSWKSVRFTDDGVIQVRKRLGLQGQGRQDEVFSDKRTIQK